MSLMRWNPMSDMLSLRDAMDRLMSESFVRPFGNLGNFSNLLSEMYEDDNEYVIKVVMPGIKPEDVELTISGDVLSVQGRTSQTDNQEEDKNRHYHVRQSGYREFSQSVTLPGPVQSDKATADCENGIITIHLPKAEEARAKRIQVQTKGQPKMIEHESGDGHKTTEKQNA